MPSPQEIRPEFSRPIPVSRLDSGALEVKIVANPAEAVSRALGLAEPADVVFVTGSLYLAGDLRPFLREMAEHNGKITCPQCGKVHEYSAAEMGAARRVNH